MRRAGWLGPAVLAVGLVLSSASLLVQARHLWFFGDEWDFLLRRDLGSDLLVPHNEHWSTLPILAYRLMYALFGLHAYLPYAALAVLVHCGVCVLAYRLLRGRDLSAVPSALAVLVLGFCCLRTVENPLWAFQIGFMGSALFGLVAVLLWQERTWGRGTIAWIWLASLASLLCSGMALPMLMFLGAVALFDGGLRRALVLTVPPGLVFLAWHAEYGGVTGQSTKASTVGAVGEFTLSGLAFLWQPVAATVPVIGVLVLAAAVGSVLVGPADAARRLGRAGLLTMVATYVLLGVSRAGLGNASALSGRYSYFTLLFCLPALLCAVRLVAAHVRVPRVVAAVAAVAVFSGLAGWGVLTQVTFREGRNAVMPDLESRVVGAAALIRTGEPLIARQVEPGLDPDIFVDGLREADRDGKLPDVRATVQERLAAANTLQVLLSFERVPGLPDASVTGSGVTGARVPATGCQAFPVEANGWIELDRSAEGGQVALKVPSGRLFLELVDGRVGGGPRPLVFGADALVHVGTSSPTATLRVYPVGTSVEVCAPGSS